MLKLDLDHDGKKDRVYIKNEKDNKFYLVCELSSQKFMKMKNVDLDYFTNAHISETDSGFRFNVNYMRSGMSWQFRYEKKTKRMRLIGMSSYSFGNVANDGSGEVSVNLLTNKYIGDLNYYYELEEKLIGLHIEKKTQYKKIYLEDFFDEKNNIDDSDWYEETKAKDLKERQRKHLKSYLTKQFPNYGFLKLKETHVNDDLLTDYIVILQSKKKGEPYTSLDDAYGRKVLLIESWADAFKILAQKDKLFCGGSTGDP